MSRPNPAILFGFFVALIVAMCGLPALKGGLYLGKHELDTLHLLEMIFRMANGDWPHIDFSTPIGALAMWPISIFVGSGMGIGMSIIASQFLVALVALPMVWWAAQSRLPAFPAYLFGFFVLTLITALVHGEAERSVSISMHYNRWSWAFAFIAILLAVVEPRKRASAIDGVIIGTSMFILLMIKVTYFGAFIIPIAAGLLMRKDLRAFLVAMLCGLLLMLVPTILKGPEFWVAYLNDLLLVAGSSVRPYPGGSFSTVVGAPAYLGASLLLIASIIILRRTHLFAGLMLWLLMPGFFYVTYQNYANDPQWLYLLAVLLLTFVPAIPPEDPKFGRIKMPVIVAAAMALALAMPSFFNLVYSPFRHMGIPKEDYVLFFRDWEQQNDLYTARVRAYRADVRAPLDVTGTPAEPYADIEQKLEATEWRGETLAICSLELGMIAWFQAMSDEISSAGFSGPDKSIMMADLVSSIWLFGDFAPVPGGSPWYYGGLPGIENADYLMVPLCPATHDIRGSILQDVEERGVELTEVLRTKLLLLYEIGEVPPPPPPEPADRDEAT